MQKIMQYQQLGDIVLIKRHKWKKLKKNEKKEVLNKLIKRPGVRLVSTIGPVKGKYRTPSKTKVLKVKPGLNKSLITVHEENKCFYKLDVSKLMFSKGNRKERARIAKIASNKEIVLDMFAGIGYFTLPLAKKVSLVYAIEINPVAYRYLIENIKLNNLVNVIPLLGDAADICKKLSLKFDRIVMGLLPNATDYLQDALKLAKRGTVLHISIISTKPDLRKKIKKIKAECELFFKKVSIKVIKVKSYAPKVWHYCLDVKIIE